LDAEQQIDIRAYWSVKHGHSDARYLLSTPATMQDLTSVLLLSRGHKPGAHASRSQRAVRAAVPVKVIGGDGRVTPALQAAAEGYSRANLGRHWASKTGSKTDAIAWATKGD